MQWLAALGEWGCAHHNSVAVLANAATFVPPQQTCTGLRPSVPCCSVCCGRQQQCPASHAAPCCASEAPMKVWCSVALTSCIFITSLLGSHLCRQCSQKRRSPAPCWRRPLGQAHQQLLGQLLQHLPRWHLWRQCTTAQAQTSTSCRSWTLLKPGPV